MKKTFAKAALLSALYLSTSLSAHAADKYTFDPTHTAVIWQANHLGFSNPSGRFMGIEGSITLDEKNPTNSSVSVTIPTGNVVTGIDKFNEHLKSKDFFNVSDFPNATFVSNKVEMTGKDTAKVHGALTLLGVSKDVVLDVKLNKIGENPLSKKKTVGFSAKTTLKRSEFEMKYGLPNVSDEVLITIEAEAAL